MPSVATIREALPITGRRILEVTTDDFVGQLASRVYLHLDDGTTASFVIGGEDLAFSYDGFPDGHPFLKNTCDEDDFDSD